MTTKEVAELLGVSAKTVKRNSEKIGIVKKDFTEQDVENIKAQIEKNKNRYSDPYFRKKQSESHKGFKHTDEAKRKISESLIGNTRTKGRVLSKEHREKISAANKGRIVTEETRKKLVKANTGKTLSEETRKKLSLINTGKTLSEETKKKISESEIGHIVTEETKKKISITHTGMTHSEETKKKMSESAKSRKPIEYINTYKQEHPEFDGIFVKEIYEEKGYANTSSLLKHPLTKRVYFGNKTLVYFEKEDADKIKKGFDGKSKPEIEIAEWLKQYIEIEESNRTILNGKELDIYIPSKKVAIEFDGLYFHSNQFRDKQYHYWKFDECRKQGIRLIHIFEDEWREKQDIVKSLLLSSIGIYSKKHFARKCTVKEIEKSVAKQFLNENHINGYVNCSKAYGLFNGTELLQVITVGKNRFNKEKKLELLRMATKLNTQVVGGFSKLLKDANITEIESYVDNRLFNASGYISSGWTVLEETPISYYYTNFESRFNRMKFQKAKLPQVGENDTEEMRANALGFYRIYDCGTTKLSYKS